MMYSLTSLCGRSIIAEFDSDRRNGLPVGLIDDAP